MWMCLSSISLLIILRRDIVLYQVVESMGYIWVYRYIQPKIAYRNFTQTYITQPLVNTWYRYRLEQGIY